LTGQFFDWTILRRTILRPDNSSTAQFHVGQFFASFLFDFGPNCEKLSSEELSTGKIVQSKNCPGEELSVLLKNKLSEELSGEKFSARRTVRGKFFRAKNCPYAKNVRGTNCPAKNCLSINCPVEELSGRRIVRVNNCPGEELAGRRIVLKSRMAAID
jgi:hypothetical protein